MYRIWRSVCDPQFLYTSSHMIFKICYALLNASWYFRVVLVRQKVPNILIFYNGDLLNFFFCIELVLVVDTLRVPRRVYPLLKQWTPFPSPSSKWCTFLWSCFLLHSSYSESDCWCAELSIVKLFPLLRLFCFHFCFCGGSLSFEFSKMALLFQSSNIEMVPLNIWNAGLNMEW